MTTMTSGKISVLDYFSDNPDFPVGHCGKVCPLIEISFVWLTKNKVAIIDKYDLWFAQQYNWYANSKNNGFYAASRTHGTHVYLHRMLLGPPPDKIVDHINGNTLDDRRQNLRVVSVLDNNRNRRYRA